MNIYVKLIIVLLIVLALAEFFPEAVNWVLLLILIGSFLIGSKQFAALIAQLKF